MNKIRSYPHHQYCITGLLLFLLALLSSCGGGIGSGLQLANGLGGTGITMGRVTGFGSVYVNGIHFNTDNATFFRDGIADKAQDDFHAGEIVKVKGTVNSDGKTGTATEVSFSDVLEGSVTATASNNTLKILEQTVMIDSLTLFHGFKKLADLQLGNIVEVSGFTNAQGAIEATSITLLQQGFTAGSILEVEGNISVLDTTAKTFKINDLLVDYSSALLSNIVEADLSNGLYLIVSTAQDISNGTITAAEVLFINDTLEIGLFYEIEGLISRFASPTDFDIEGFKVTTNAQTVYKNGSAADLKRDVRSLIIGRVNDQGVIVAEEITLLESSSEAIILATIEAINLTDNTFTILGETVLVDGFTLLSDDTTDDFLELSLDQFSVGDPVFVVARRINQGKTVAIRLSKTTAIILPLLLAVVESATVDTGSITVFGKTINTDGNTVYFDREVNIISSAVFFSQLIIGSTVVDVGGHLLADGSVLADELQIIE